MVNVRLLGQIVHFAVSRDLSTEPMQLVVSKDCTTPSEIPIRWYNGLPGMGSLQGCPEQRKRIMTQRDSRHGARLVMQDVFGHCMRSLFGSAFFYLFFFFGGYRLHLPSSAYIPPPRPLLPCYQQSLLQLLRASTRKETWLEHLRGTAAVVGSFSGTVELIINGRARPQTKEVGGSADMVASGNARRRLSGSRSA